MKMIRAIAGVFGIGTLLLATPGILIDLHDSWFENAFHILAFGGLGAYAIYFGLTGRYKVGATNENSEIA